MSVIMIFHGKHIMVPLLHCHMFLALFLFIFIITTLAKLFRISRNNEILKPEVFSLPDQCQSPTFKVKYDETQKQLESISGMDNLLSGILTCT